MIYDAAADVAVHPISSDVGMLQLLWRTWKNYGKYMLVIQAKKSKAIS